MAFDADLRQKARRAIDAGKLPDRSPDRTWGGPGTGTDCVVCGELMSPDTTEIEMEFERGGGAANYHAHVACFRAWEREQSDRGGSGPAATEPALPKNPDASIILGGDFEGRFTTRSA